MFIPIIEVLLPRFRVMVQVPSGSIGSLGKGMVSTTLPSIRVR